MSESSLQLNRLASAAFVAAWLTLAGGCSNVDPNMRNCAEIRRTYAYMSMTSERFQSYDLDTQYSILICGSQYRHPPMLFSNEFAKGGEPAAHYLAQRLEETEHDPTISEIVNVFSDMSKQNTFYLRDHPRMLALVQSKVSAMKAGPLRDITEAHMEEIREPSSDAVREWIGRYRDEFQ